MCHTGEETTHRAPDCPRLTQSNFVVKWDADDHADRCGAAVGVKGLSSAHAIGVGDGVADGIGIVSDGASDSVGGDSVDDIGIARGGVGDSFGDDIGIASGGFGDRVGDDIAIGGVGDGVGDSVGNSDGDGIGCTVAVPKPRVGAAPLFVARWLTRRRYRLTANPVVYLFPPLKGAGGSVDIGDGVGVCSGVGDTVGDALGSGVDVTSGVGDAVGDGVGDSVGVGCKGWAAVTKGGRHSVTVDFSVRYRW